MGVSVGGGDSLWFGMVVLGFSSSVVRMFTISASGFPTRDLAIVSSFWLDTCMVWTVEGEKEGG